MLHKGKLWFADWRDENGQRRRQGFKTKKQAQAFQRERRAHVAAKKERAHRR